jgi:hypothetical protein
MPWILWSPIYDVCVSFMCLCVKSQKVIPRVATSCPIQANHVILSHHAYAEKLFIKSNMFQHI